MMILMMMRGWEVLDTIWGVWSHFNVFFCCNEECHDGYEFVLVSWYVLSTPSFN